MQPETSQEAYHSLKFDDIKNVYVAILRALGEIGQGTSEQVATHTGIPHERLWKRFSELERDEKIYNTKIKHKNKSGRNAFQYALRGSETKLSETEKIMTGNNVNHYAGKILSQVDLFGEQK